MFCQHLQHTLLRLTLFHYWVTEFPWTWILSRDDPHISAGCYRSASNRLLVKLPKSRITAHLHSFIPLFFLPLEQTPSLYSIPFFPPGLQNSCSPPPLVIPHSHPRSFLPPLIHPKPTSFKFPAFLPESPYSAHLVYPMYPAPSLFLPQIS